MDGLPLNAQPVEGQRLLFERRSPFGNVSVVEWPTGMGLNIDGRRLCGFMGNSPEEMRQSEWVLGKVSGQLVSGTSPRVANVGLGCGMTMAALLQNLPAKASLEVIELNPMMEEAQKLFRPRLPHGLDDPRAKLTIADGFAHFLNAPVGAQYDAVVIDVAWMQNMNATHLFSAEMYHNLSWRLKPGGFVAVWSEEAQPFSPVALIQYNTLKSVFPHVAVDASTDSVLFYASMDRPLDEAVSPRDRMLPHWMDLASARSPVNRLDDLAMNRHKFTVWGDSTSENLKAKYSMPMSMVRATRSGW